MVEQAQSRGRRGSSLRVPTLVQPLRVGPVDTWVSRGVREVALKQAVKDLLSSSLLSLQSQEVHEEFAFVLQIRIENS